MIKLPFTVSIFWCQETTPGTPHFLKLVLAYWVPFDRNLRKEVVSSLVSEQDPKCTCG